MRWAAIASVALLAAACGQFGVEDEATRACTEAYSSQAQTGPGAEREHAQRAQRAITDGTDGDMARTLALLQAIGEAVQTCGMTEAPRQGA